MLFEAQTLKFSFNTLLEEAFIYQRNKKQMSSVPCQDMFSVYVPFQSPKTGKGCFKYEWVLDRLKPERAWHHY